MALPYAADFPRHEFVGTLHTRGRSARNEHAADLCAAKTYLEAVLGAAHRSLPTPAAGDVFALIRSGIERCGLTVEGEPVALSGFPVNET
jgi:hypothetical protein